MPVTNALVSLVEESIVWYVIVLDVLLDLLERPIGHGIDLDQARLVDFDYVQVASFASLAPPSAREDCACLQFTVSPLCRLDFDQVIISVVVDLPQLLAIFLGELLGCLHTPRLVDMDVDQRVSRPDALEEVQGLGEVMQRIDEDEVDHLRPGDLQLGQHVQLDEAREAKGGGLEEVGECCDAPSQDLLRLEELKLAIEELKVRLGEVHLRHADLTVLDAGIT